MVFEKLFKTVPASLDNQEAYNLWDTLRTRYDVIEQVQIFENFMHDIDFKLLSEHILLELFEEQASELEDLLNKFELNLPRKPPKSVRTSANTQAFHDRYIAINIMSLLQENVGLHIRAFRSSITNDEIRKLFRKYAIKEVELYDDAVQYVKLKGWLGTPPRRNKNNEENIEPINSGEEFHLWDHLSSRYDQLEITQIYESYANDNDLKQVLQTGIKKSLKEQINRLEQEMNYFGLPLSQRPPENKNLTVDKQNIADELIYRRLLTGLQYMLDLHSTGMKQCTTNDRIRELYKNFLKNELEVFDNFVKYGKVKGWITPTPEYK